jgi:predicted phosphohydrolase
MSKNEIALLGNYLENELLLLNHAILNFSPSLLIGSAGSFDTIIDWNPTRPKPDFHVNMEAFEKEPERLKQALALFRPEHLKRVVMIHYPPIGLLKESSKASELLEAYGVEVSVFGHLHSLKPQSASFGNFRHIDYVFCAGDYIGFKPINLFSLAQGEKG